MLPTKPKQFCFLFLFSVKKHIMCEGFHPGSTAVPSEPAEGFTVITDYIVPVNLQHNDSQAKLQICPGLDRNQMLPLGNMLIISIRQGSWFTSNNSAELSGVCYHFFVCLFSMVGWTLFKQLLFLTLPEESIGTNYFTQHPTHSKGSAKRIAPAVCS